MAIRSDEKIDPERFAYDILVHQLPLFGFMKNELPSSKCTTNSYRWFSDQIPISCLAIAVMGLSVRDMLRTIFEAEDRQGGLQTIEQLVTFYRFRFLQYHAQSLHNKNHFLMMTGSSLAFLVELALFLKSMKRIPLVECLPKIWADIYEEFLKKKLEKKEGGLNVLKRFGDLQKGAEKYLKDFIKNHAKNYASKEKVSGKFEVVKSLIINSSIADDREVKYINDEYVFTDMQRDIERRKKENLKAGIEESEDDEDDDSTPEMSLAERLCGTQPTTH